MKRKSLFNALFCLSLATAACGQIQSTTQITYLKSWVLGTINYNGGQSEVLTITADKNYQFFLGSKLTEYVMASLLNYKSSVDDCSVDGNGAVKEIIVYYYNDGNYNIATGIAFVVTDGGDAAVAPFVSPSWSTKPLPSPITQNLCGISMKNDANGNCRCGVLFYTGANNPYTYVEFTTSATATNVQADYWMSKLVKTTLGPVGVAGGYCNNIITVYYDATQQITSISFPEQ